MFSLSALLCAQDDAMTIVSKDGQPLQVTLKSLKDEKVSFVITKTRKSFTVPITKLDLPSQKKIRAWKLAGGGASTQFEIDLATGKSNQLSKFERYDDRSLVMTPEVKIMNTSGSDSSAKDLSVTVLILGRSVLDRNKMFIFAKEEHELPVLDPRKEASFKLKKIEASYDDRGNDGSEYGSKYLGYVVLIHQGKKIISQKAVPKTMDKYGKLWFGVEKDQYYSNTLELEKSDRYRYR